MRELLSLESNNDRLRVTVERRPAAVPGGAVLFDLHVEAIAHPFAGVVSQIVMAEDLSFFRSNLAGLQAPGEVIFGGERMLELRLRVHSQIGRQPDRLVVEVELTPSGDDPFPSLRWLLFDQEPFVDRLVKAIDDALAD